MPIHSSTLQVPPKSPKTPSQRQFAHGQMGHAIPHQFNKTFKPGKCNFCSEYMFNGKFLLSMILVIEMQLYHIYLLFQVSNVKHVNFVAIEIVNIWYPPLVDLVKNWWMPIWANFK